MQRRHLLAALGTGISLAGCLGTGSPGTPTSDETSATETTSDVTETTTGPRETTPPTADHETLALSESFETADGRTVTVHDVRVQRIVFTRGVHVDPHTRSGEQFVVADASVPDPDLLDGFTVAADGRTVDTGGNDAVVAPFRDPTGELLGFRVSAPLTADRAAVVWSGSNGTRARWPLDDGLLRALANPPEFAVEGFEVPGEVERGSSFTASLTVANSGSGDGTFRAELGATTISDTPEIRVEVPAGETVSAERTLEPYYPEDADEMTIRLNWSADFIERTVAVV